MDTKWKIFRRKKSSITSKARGEDSVKERLREDRTDNETLRRTKVVEADSMNERDDNFVQRVKACHQEQT